MNIQIFGTKKCKDTRKAQRWFKERRIPFQFVDLKEKPMSRGEFDSVAAAVGGVDEMIDTSSKQYSSVAYLVDEDVADKVFENQMQLLKTPVVRNGRQAAFGLQSEVWESWS